jgi:hypothetical protein
MMQSFGAGGEKLPLANFAAHPTSSRRAAQTGRAGFQPARDDAREEQTCS